jgi:hypothetical protein
VEQTASSQFRENLSERLGAGSALGNDRVPQNANRVDLDLNDVTRFHP